MKGADKLLACIAKHGLQTNDEIARKTQLPAATVRRLTRQLLEANRIERVGAARPYRLAISGAIPLHPKLFKACRRRLKSADRKTAQTIVRNAHYLAAESIHGGKEDD